MTKPAKWALRTFMAIALLVLIILGVELYVGITTNEKTAAQHIQVVFVEVCTSSGHNAADFEGPFLKKKDFRSYEFYWENPKSHQTALGLLQLFPTNTEIWILEPEKKR